MNIIIIGRTQLLYETIEKLKNVGHHIVAIVTAKAAPEYTKDEFDFQEKAQELGCLFFCDSNINKIFLDNDLSADLGISVNWPSIINYEVISQFKYGILNAHTGDLPRYRGNACPNWAIINGEDRIGVSIHFMEPGELDSGPIVHKKYIICNEKTTISHIYIEAEKMIPEMFVEAVDKLSADPSCAVSQNDNPQKSLRCFPRITNDSLIDWNRDSVSIDRLIRASCWPFAGAYTYCNGIKIHILHSKIKHFNYPVCVCPGQVVYIDKYQHIVDIACSDGIISIEKICDENGEELDPDKVINSMRIRLGVRIEDKLYELEKRLELIEKMNIIKDK